MQDLDFKRDGLNIHGQLFLPEGVEQPPVVIVSHSFAGSYRHMRKYAKAFAAGGVAAYAYDFCGGSMHSSSDGDPLDMTVLTEVADLESVMDGVRSLGSVDGERLFLMGESQGGLVSALVAARKQAQVKGLVLLYPAFVIPDDARRKFGSVESIPDQSDEFGIPTSRKYYTDVWDMDAYAEAARYTGPVLIVQGDADDVVPLASSRRAANAYSNARLEVIHGAGHGFYDDEFDQASAWAGEFVSSLADPDAR